MNKKILIGVMLSCFLLLVTSSIQPITANESINENNKLLNDLELVEFELKNYPLYSRHYNPRVLLTIKNNGIIPYNSNVRIVIYISTLFSLLPRYKIDYTEEVNINGLEEISFWTTHNPEFKLYLIPHILRMSCKIIPFELDSNLLNNKLHGCSLVWSDGFIKIY